MCSSVFFYLLKKWRVIFFGINVGLWRLSLLELKLTNWLVISCTFLLRNSDILTIIFVYLHICMH